MRKNVENCIVLTEMLASANIDTIAHKNKKFDYAFYVNIDDFKFTIWNHTADITICFEGKQNNKISEICDNNNIAYLRDSKGIAFIVYSIDNNKTITDICNNVVEFFQLLASLTTEKREVEKNVTLFSDYNLAEYVKTYKQWRKTALKKSRAKKEKKTA